MMGIKVKPLHPILTSFKQISPFIVCGYFSGLNARDVSIQNSKGIPDVLYFADG
jgi:hypothetical protein